jgi:hypothetical protein
MGGNRTIYRLRDPAVGDCSVKRSGLLYLLLLRSAAHKSNPIKQTAKQINQICQNLISNQTNAKYRIWNNI